MNDENRRTAEMATRMKGYGVMTAGGFPANSIGGQRFSLLNDLSDNLDLFGSREAQEKGAAKAAKAAKDSVLINIRRKMKAMRKTAVSIEPLQPGISQHFNMPSSQSAESLIEAARAFVAAATPLKPLFLSREMPENFLEALMDDIQSYEDAVNNYNLHSANRSAARTMVSEVCSQVLEVRRELDPIVRNKYKDDPEKVALWETASHLERPAKKSGPAEPEGPNQPPSGGQT